MGSDRLGLHYWSLQAQYLTRDPAPSVSIGYGTYLTAPWFTQLSGSYNYSEGFKDWIASLSTSRTYYTWPVSFGFTLIDRDAPATTDDPAYRARAVGPSASIGYSAYETTPYGGAQRGLGLDLGAAYFPKAFASTENVADVRGEIDGAIPLPFLKRQQFTLSVVARAVPSDRHNLLRVGGGGPIAIYRNTPNRSSPDAFGVAPGLAFSESLRGFEDLSVSADSVVKAGANWRYSFIIDKGWASLLYLFPAYFIRQVDVEAFGSAAMLDPNKRRDPTSTTNGLLLRGAGGALHYRASIGNAPVTLVYQFAYRFDQGLGAEHIFGIQLE